MPATCARMNTARKCGSARPAPRSSTYSVVPAAPSRATRPAPARRPAASPSQGMRAPRRAAAFSGPGSRTSRPAPRTRRGRPAAASKRTAAPGGPGSRAGTGERQEPRTRRGRV
jgi:hypothetical protein